MAESKSLRSAYGEALAELGAENDKIVVLDDGGMAGIGSHEELLASCEVYREIAASQEKEGTL